MDVAELPHRLGSLALWPIDRSDSACAIPPFDADAGIGTRQVVRYVLKAKAPRRRIGKGQRRSSYLCLTSSYRNRTSRISFENVAPWAETDHHDEVWDGVYVMSPDPDNQHQELAGDLRGAIKASLDSVAGARVFQGSNISDRAEDWRTKNYPRARRSRFFFRATPRRIAAPIGSADPTSSSKSAVAATGPARNWPSTRASASVSSRWSTSSCIPWKRLDSYRLRGQEKAFEGESNPDQAAVGIEQRSQVLPHDFSCSLVETPIHAPRSRSVVPAMDGVGSSDDGTERTGLCNAAHATGTLGRVARQFQTPSPRIGFTFS